VMTARGALELATLGGARVLGRDDIGALKRIDRVYRNGNLCVVGGRLVYPRIP